MSTLPVCVRLALWLTAAFAAGTEPAEAFARAAPDVVPAELPAEAVADWLGLGERAVFVALPRPGDLTSLPPSDHVLRDAAILAGECVYSPSVGGALVPELTEFGPHGDRGLLLAWSAYPCDPLPAHIAQSWSLRDARRELTTAVHETTAVLEALDLRPWNSPALRDVADERHRAKRWGLPRDLPPQAADLLASAAIIATACELGLEHLEAGHSLTGHLEREARLRSLAAYADRALERATNIASSSLAGWRS